MAQVFEEFQLDNLWRVCFTPDDVGDEHGRIYTVRMDIARRNGDEWDLTISGQLKWDGCQDWGFGSQVLMHFCGKQDTQIFALAYDRARDIIGKDFDE